MKLYNPTGWEIKAQAGGVAYNFKPYEEKEVWNPDHIVTLLDGNAKNLGLVHLHFDDSQQKKHESFDIFKKAQAKKGLEFLLKHQTKALLNEKQAMIDLDAADKEASSEYFKSFVNPKKFEEKVEQVKDWIRQLDEEPKRGRKKKVIEPLANENLAAA